MRALLLRRVRRLTVFLFYLGLFLPAYAKAPSTDSAASAATHVTLGQSIIALNGPWKFHIGDSPEAGGAKGPLWAGPDFDDSQWETISLTPAADPFHPVSGQAGYAQGWTAKGHPGYWGYAWYRIRVQVTGPAGEGLALLGPTEVDDVYQVFGNGGLLGSFGKFSAGGRPPVVYYTQPQMFRLAQLQSGKKSGTELRTQVLAFRVWMAPSSLLVSSDGGGLHTAPLLGIANTIEARYRLAWLELMRAYASYAMLAALFFVLAVVACGLSLFDRSDAVYLWLTTVFLLMAITYAETPVSGVTQIVSAAAYSFFVNGFLTPLIQFGWVMVWWVWFRLRYPAWMPKLIAGLTVLYMLSGALGLDLFFTLLPHPVSASFHLVSIVTRLLFLPLLVFIVVRGIQAQEREGWLALPAIVLMGVAQFEGESRLLHIRMIWFPFGTPVTFPMIAGVALAATMFALLMRRLLLSLRRQREMALDVKQAQEVQHVLVPERITVPGLTIESEYRPAREVGGDFFQIIPQSNDGSVLIVAGDVTGKGLQAGMLVALLVGAIRSTAECSADPQFILDALNRRLLGRSDAHATCLALCIKANGAVTLANAGHLPPYVDGVEVPMEGALPLGMLPSADFPVSQFQLAKGDTLTLISDGVVEAQNRNGQLFGFDRVRDLLQTKLSAADLATAAQTFGQEDDISVVSVTWA
jgi:hypothetical protein